MKRKIITSIIIFAFALCSLLSVYATAPEGRTVTGGQSNATMSLMLTPKLPSDTPSSWAQAQVNAAIDAGLVPEELHGKYTQATTRAEFAALAVTLYEKATGKVIAAGNNPFTDTTDINAIKAAAIAVTTGTSATTFNPSALLTREQAATMLARLANAAGKPLAKKAATFSDNGSISPWALEAVGQMQTTGIMGGVGNNTFAPKDPYTREQSIVTIMRLYNVLKNELQSIVGLWKVISYSLNQSSTSETLLVSEYRFRRENYIDEQLLLFSSWEVAPDGSLRLHIPDIFNISAIYDEMKQYMFESGNLSALENFNKGYLSGRWFSSDSIINGERVYNIELEWFEPAAVYGTISVTSSSDLTESSQQLRLTFETGEVLNLALIDEEADALSIVGIWDFFSMRGPSGDIGKGGGFFDPDSVLMEVLNFASGGSLTEEFLFTSGVLLGASIQFMPDGMFYVEFSDEVRSKFIDLANSYIDGMNLSADEQYRMKHDFIGVFNENAWHLHGVWEPSGSAPDGNRLFSAVFNDNGSWGTNVNTGERVLLQPDVITGKQLVFELTPYDGLRFTIPNRDLTYIRAW